MTFVNNGICQLEIIGSFQGRGAECIIKSRSSSEQQYKSMFSAAYLVII